jgi:hypothetical protein
MSEASPPLLPSGGQLLGRERERKVLDRLLVSRVLDAAHRIVTVGVLV